MNGLGKPLRKKSDPKNRNDNENQSEIVNKKPVARRRFFVRTAFSNSTLNLERKTFTPQNHWLFAPLTVTALSKSLLN